MPTSDTEAEDLDKARTAVADAEEALRKAQDDLVEASAPPTALEFDDGRYRMAVNALDDVLTLDADRTRAAWQALPVATGTPGGYARRTVVILPAEARDASLEGTRALDLDLAGRHLTRTATLADGRLTVVDRITSSGVEIAASALPAERAKLAQVKSGALRLVAPQGLPTRPGLIRAGGRARYQALRDHYSAALKIDKPDETEGWTSRGNFLAGIYDFPGAIADYSKAIEIEPALSSLTTRAALYNKIGANAKALADWRVVHDRDPGDVITVAGLARQLVLAGDHRGAIKLLDERIAQGGDDRFRAMSEKADVLVSMGDGAGAVAVMDEVLAAKPGVPGFLNARCWTKATADLALDTALKDCTRAIELSENSVASLDSRGVVYFRMGRMEEALADFDAVLAQHWNMPETLYMRSLTHRRMGHAKDADRDLADAVLMDPSLPETYAAWGIK